MRQGNQQSNGPGQNAAENYSPQQFLSEAETLNGKPLTDAQQAQLQTLVETRNAAIKKAQDDFRRGAAQILGKSVEELDSKANAMHGKSGQNGQAGDSQGQPGRPHGQQ